MTLETFISQAWIPLLMCIVCYYYAWRLLAKQDITCVRNKQMKPIRKKDEKAYVNKAGHIFLYYAIAVTINIGLSFINSVIAFVEILIATIVMFLGWKKLKDTYE